MSDHFQEIISFSLTSSSQLYGFFTDNHRSVTKGQGIPSTIQMQGSSVTFIQKGGIVIDNPLKDEPFYKISVILADANEQSLTAFLTVIDRLWSAQPTQGVSAGIDTFSSSNTYWWDHTQFKMQAELDSHT